jgi:hypothetical protein
MQVEDKNFEIMNVFPFMACVHWPSLYATALEILQCNGQGNDTNINKKFKSFIILASGVIEN